MASDPRAPRPVNPPPPRYARGWCPRCKHWLEVQFGRPPMPDKMICKVCNYFADVASVGRCPLKGSHPATAVWEG